MVTTQQYASRVTEGLEGKTKSSLNVVEITLLLKYLEKLRDDTGEDEAQYTYIDGIKVVF